MKSLKTSIRNFAVLNTSVTFMENFFAAVQIISHGKFKQDY